MCASSADAQLFRRRQPTYYRQPTPRTVVSQQTTPITAPRPDPPAGITEEGIREVIRLGDSVQEIGVGPQNNPSAIFAAVAAPPPDDSHKWYITVIVTPNCRYCSTLLNDFKSAPQLKAFADPDDFKQSWSHYNVFRSDDTTQQWRWAGIKIESYPTILIQPPLNGSYGDAKTVVMQHSGYDGDSAALAKTIREHIRAYITTKSGGYQQTTITQSRLPPVAAPYDPPTVLPTTPLADPIGPPRIRPQKEPEEDTERPLPLDILKWVTLLLTVWTMVTSIFYFFASSLWTNILLIILIWIVWRCLKWLRRRQKTLILESNIQPQPLSQPLSQPQLHPVRYLDHNPEAEHKIVFK